MTGSIPDGVPRPEDRLPIAGIAHYGNRDGIHDDQGNADKGPEKEGETGWERR